MISQRSISLLYLYICLAGILAGCSRAEALFIADPLLVEALGPEQEFRQRASRTAASVLIDLDLNRIPMTNTLFEEVRKAVAASGAGVVIVGPLFLDRLPALLSEFPDKTFIIPGTYAPYTPPENIRDQSSRYIIVVFDRIAVFRTAGSLFARKIAALDSGNASGSENRETLSDGPGAGAVFFTGSAVRKQEMQAFIEGYGMVEGAPVLVTREVSSLRRLEELQLAVDQIIDSGAEAVFVAVSGLNVDAYELLSQHPLYIAGERTPGSVIPPGRLLFSIEENFFPALGRGLTAFVRKETGVFTLEPEIVEGKTAGAPITEKKEETTVSE